MEQQVTFEYTLTVRLCIDTIVTYLRRVDVEPRPVIAIFSHSLRVPLVSSRWDAKFALNC
jgi:hypothetical protein